MAVIFISKKQINQTMKGNLMKFSKAVLTGSLAVFLMLFTSMCSMADYEDTVKKSFNVSNGGLLTIETDRGSIEISTHDKAVVDVELVRKLGSESLVDNVITDMQHEGANVTIQTKVKKSLLNFSRDIKLKYLVTVPKEYNLDLSTAGGSISVDDLNGKVDVKTSGGSLAFGNINGPVNGKTSGGSIKLQECKGTVMVNTSGGSISIGQVKGDVEAKTSGGSIKIDKASGSVIAKTSGGSIKIEEVMGDIQASTSGGSVTAHITEQPGGDCSLTTSGGSVKIHLSESIKANVDAKTSGGKVITDLPVKTTVQGEVKKNHLQGTINGGGPELYLRTSGGNIYINEI